MPLFILNIFLGFAGFLLALYITHKKHRKSEHFICPLRGSCTEVINSRFSTFFGIPVEYLGLAYYSIIAVGYGLRAVWPDFNGTLIVPLLFLSTFALIFSFYLTFIQIFTIRKLCTWCLISALFTLFIFCISLSTSIVSVIPLLIQYQTIVTLVHATVLAVGLGAASLADLFFFKFLQDSRISEMEADVLNTFSEVIWFSIGVIVMTGLGIYLPQMGTLLASDQFVMTLIIFSVIIVNGAFLNLFVAPRFLRIQFGEHEHAVGELTNTRILAFFLGPISIVSWFALFILTFLKTAPASFEVMWRTYIVFMIIAVLIGQLIQKIGSRSNSV